MPLHQRCAYLVVVHEKALHSVEELPAVPGVTYIYYGGACYEWGIVGWALHSRMVAWQHYSYFIFLSSAVRGPFLPTYLQERMHWTQPLLRCGGGSVCV